MLRPLFLSLLTLLSCIQLQAQEKEPFDKYDSGNIQIDIGTVVPDFRLHQVMNYKGTGARLSDFHGKAILIDFWAAFCQPCLAQFPKLQHFQEQFSEDLQVITITNDKYQQVTELFENIRYQGFHLLTAARGNDNNSNDSLFYAFPHRYIPHYVWIDKNRVLRAVTGYEEMTTENITALIKGQPLNVKNKQDGISPDTDASHPAIYSYQESDIAEKMMLNDSIKGLIAYSMLTGYNRKYPPSSAVDRSGIYEGRRIRTWNLPLSTMFRIAYGRIGKDITEQELLPAPRVFYNIRDKKLLHKLMVSFTQAPDTTDDLYCYDLITGNKEEQLLVKRMKEDLYRYFGIKGQITKRKVWCYILIMKDSSKLNTAGGDSYAKGNMYYLQLRNQPFCRLIEHIRSYNESSKAEAYQGIQSGIIVDETGFAGQIDISLNAKMNDINALKLALNNYGLDLKKGERWINVLLLED